MDIKTLVKINVQMIEDALADDGYHIKLTATPFEEGYLREWVIYAKSSDDFKSCRTLIETISTKLFSLTDSSFRSYISHIQVYDRYKNEHL